MEFRKSNRWEMLEHAQNQLFEVLIIGGGITGAGVALDASSRGLSTIMVEKDDFSEGTSSRSTKLVHGGLRYLKTFEIKLVRDAGRERAILYQNAAHIVYPQKMILPIYKGHLYGKVLTSFGLWIYDLLAGVEPKYKKRTLSKIQVLDRLPLLKEEGLKGGVQYYEYRTQDTRLVIENIKKSVELGSIALNYTEFKKINYEKDGVLSVTVYDKVTNKEYKIKTKTIVNATGVWADSFLKDNAITNQKYILPSKGIHILVDKTKVPIHIPVYFELKDDRMIFAIPTENKVYIGTTDSKFDDDLNEVYANNQEIEYLLKAFNSYFNITLTIKDVEITWAGIRPLVKASNNQLHNVSRKEKIVVHNKQIISVFGGKLTAYRLMAERTVNQIFKMLPASIEYKKSKSKHISLSGADFDFEKIEEYKIIEYVERKFYEAYQLNANTDLINTLFYTYGKNIEKIIERAFDIYNNIDNRAFVWLEAEIWYAVNNEMVINLSDFMIRRSSRFYFSHKESMMQLNEIVRIMAKSLEWADKECQVQVNNYKKIAHKNHSIVE